MIPIVWGFLFAARSHEVYAVEKVSSILSMPVFDRSFPGDGSAWAAATEWLPGFLGEIQISGYQKGQEGSCRSFKVPDWNVQRRF